MTETRLSIWHRIVRGDPHRRSRFHDERGNLIDLAALPHLPRVLSEAVLLKRFGHRPARPWLADAALRAIAEVLHPDSRVLEFGSGMSTLWFASRCQSVDSVESDIEWFRRVEQEIRSRKIANAHIHYRPVRGAAGAELYAAAPTTAGRVFDFALVDGEHRDLCAQAAVSKLRSGAHVYLDNCDVASRLEPWRVAERVLLQAAEAAGTTPRYFTGFAPAQLHANQGLLVQV